MKLKALRAHYVAGKRIAAGGLYEADDRLGRQLVATGKSVEAAPRPGAKAGPMTTRSAEGLVPGAGADQEKPE